MSSASNDLVVENLDKAFGSQSVLCGLSLQVPAGTITAVLGHSGSGKTTLLRILAGFERPDRGVVRIGGEVVDDDRRHVPAERRRIGYVSQEGSLFPHLSVAANVGFGLPRRHRRGGRVDELLSAVGLDGLAGRYPHQLSGGQQQRVALARALAVDPRLVLLDEPFASLDAKLRVTLRADVQSILRAAGTTAVLVTHDQDEALSIADVVAVMREGSVAQVASPHDLYAHPVDAELAGFVGDVNILEGVVSGRGVDTALGTVPLDPPRASDATRTSPVVVLVRPEQIDVEPGADTTAPGVPGRVVDVEYYGHDAIVRIEPQVPGAPPTVIARILGDRTLVAGASVTIRILGSVGTWPRSPAASG